jgi:hypothetical protein
MKKRFSIWLAALSFLFAARLGANESLALDSDGYIRHWLMLAPIPLAGEEAGSAAVYRQQVRGEAELRPKPGDTIKVNGKELSWKAITASTNYFDFNAVLKSLNDRSVGYLVTYVECDSEKPDVVMTVGSNDQGRIYFNGVDIYLFSEPRQLILDGDKGKVTLKKGVNVIVFKVVNEQNAWQAAMRLLDKNGAPLKDVKIRLAP